MAQKRIAAAHFSEYVFNNKPSKMWPQYKHYAWT